MSRKRRPDNLFRATIIEGFGALIFFVLVGFAFTQPIPMNQYEDAAQTEIENNPVEHLIPEIPIRSNVPSEHHIFSLLQREY